ncbi:hypothetical protein HDU97_006634 [Phlyctochytrium planicorne]|nr:hypothetical protein HDU97_006634 [Phlyctochytrium planicorne]
MVQTHRPILPRIVHHQHHQQMLPSPSNQPPLAHPPPPPPPPAHHHSIHNMHNTSSNNNMILSMVPPPTSTFPSPAAILLPAYLQQQQQQIYSQQQQMMQVDGSNNGVMMMASPKMIVPSHSTTATRFPSSSPPVDIPSTLSPTAAAAFAVMQQQQKKSPSPSSQYGSPRSSGPLDMTLLPTSMAEFSSVLETSANNTVVDEGYGSTEKVHSPIALAVLAGMESLSDVVPSTTTSSSTSSPFAFPFGLNFDDEPMVAEQQQQQQQRKMMGSGNSLLAAILDDDVVVVGGEDYKVQEGRRNSMASTVHSFASSHSSSFNNAADWVAATTAATMDFPLFTSADMMMDGSAFADSTHQTQESQLFDMFNTHAAPSTTADHLMTATPRPRPRSLSASSTTSGSSSVASLAACSPAFFGEDVVGVENLSLMSPHVFDHEASSSAASSPIPVPSASSAEWARNFNLSTSLPASPVTGSVPAFSSASFGTVGWFAGGPVNTTSRPSLQGGAFHQHIRRKSDSVMTVGCAHVSSPTGETMAAFSPVSASSSLVAGSIEPAAVFMQKSASSDDGSVSEPGSPDPSTPSTPTTPTLPAPSSSTSRRSSGSGMFQCACGKSFSSLGSLRQHAKNHHTNRTKDFACGLCGKEFLRRQDLRRHEFTHTGERNFVCPLNCGTTFSRNDALQRHLKVRRCLK